MISERERKSDCYPPSLITGTKKAQHVCEGSMLFPKTTTSALLRRLLLLAG